MRGLIPPPPEMRKVRRDGSPELVMVMMLLAGCALIAMVYGVEPIKHHTGGCYPQIPVEAPRK